MITQLKRRLYALSFASGTATFRHIQVSALLGILALLMAAAYFSPHIWQHGEAREALVVRDIIRHDRWLLPLRNGELPSKPVLYHWIGASLTVALGYSDFTIRLPSVLAAALLAWLTYSIGDRGAERKTALLAVGILVSSFEFWHSGTEARVDMVFAAMIGATLVAWYCWYSSGSETARAMAYLAGALAVLAKGPAGAVLPALAIVAFLAWKNELRVLANFFSWRWSLMVIAIDLGWYWAAYERGGAHFLQKQIVHENIERFLGSADFLGKNNRFSEAVWLVRGLFPWSLVLLLVPIRWLSGKRENSFGHFLHAWWLSIFVFFLLSAGQRAVYLLPVYPAISLLAARECASFLHRQEVFRSRLLGAKGWAAARVFLTAFVVLLAVAIPIVRTVQEDNNAQEAFVENLVPKIPRDVPIYAAPNFPDTVRWVLAYRLDRSIPSRGFDCLGNYYYLTPKNPNKSCSPKVLSRVASISDAGPYLLRVSNEEGLAGYSASVSQSRVQQKN